MAKNTNENYEKRIKKAADLVANAKYLVVFTGAGISTESGLPDFRGPNGVWTRRDKGLPPPPMIRPWSAAEPNKGHYAIVELQNMGLLKFLISQNVDNMHLKSGITKENIAEFHGNSTLMRCLQCGNKFKKREVWDDEKWGPGYLTYPKIEGQPNCPKCGGRLVSTVVNFGDPIPTEELEFSIENSSKSDVFVVVGSSLLVSPASNMPRTALKHGANLILINNQKTPMDRNASVRFFESAGQVLEDILNEIKKSKK